MLGYNLTYVCIQNDIVSCSDQGLVITLFVPYAATATNISLPLGPPQVTERHQWSYQLRRSLRSTSLHQDWHRDHPCRTDHTFGPSTFVEYKTKSHEFIVSRMRNLEKYRHHHNHPGMLGVKGVSQFKRLPYFDLGRCHILCFMHSIMNFGTYVNMSDQRRIV